MGITNLNEIQKYSKPYNPKTFKANTIIIDGNNLLFNRLTAIRSSFLNRHMHIDLGTIDRPLLYQLVSIMQSTIRGIVEMISGYYHNSLKGERNIIIVFDPPNTPNYVIPGVGIMTLKRKEEENRILKQKKQYEKAQDKIEDLKLKYTDEIEQIYNQMSYLMNDSHINMMMPVIKNELLWIYRKSSTGSEFGFNQESVDISSHVYLIQAISEADLVICNLCKILNYAPILIRSMDSDYYVLCANLRNVYKRDISDRNKNMRTGKYEETYIYGTYKIWRDIFGKGITYRDVIMMATMAGNDYTAKSSLYGFKVESYKRIYAGDVGKITKSAIHLYPYIKAGYSTFSEIIEKYREDNEDARNSMAIYEHVDDNFLFDELKPLDANLLSLVEKIRNDLRGEFYDYENDITDLRIIENPMEYVHRIIEDINTLWNIENDMGIDFEGVSFGLEGGQMQEVKEEEKEEAGNLRSRQKYHPVLIDYSSITF